MDTYRRAFPKLRSAVSVRDDGWARRGGVDRVLTLACGRTYTVDEKVRAEDWPDILLEQWSDEKAHPGLGAEAAGLRLYCLQRVCYLLPVMPLQRAWRQRGREWIKEYGQRRTQNPGYVSVSVPVPKAVLMWAIIDAMVVSTAR